MVGMEPNASPNVEKENAASKIPATSNPDWGMFAFHLKVGSEVIRLNTDFCSARPLDGDIPRVHRDLRLTPTENPFCIFGLDVDTASG